MAETLIAPPDLFEVNENSPQLAGLVGWWPALASRGTDGLRDLIGGMHGVFAGNTATLPTFTPHPEAGWAVDFPGSGFSPSAWVEIGDADKLDGFAQMTATALVIPRISDSYFPRFFGKAGAYVLLYDQYGMYRLELATTGGAVNQSLYPPGFLAYPDFAQVGFTWDGTTASFYWRGVRLFGVSGSGSVASTSTPLYLGISQTGSGDAFNGLMADFRLYDRALSPEEMRSLFDPTTRWDLYKRRRRHYPGVTLVGGVEQGEAHLQAAAAVAPASLRRRTSGAGLSGFASVSAAPSKQHNGTCSLTGQGGMSAAPVRMRPFHAGLTAAAICTATSVRTRSGACAVTGAGQAAGIPTVQKNSAAALFATGNSTAAGARTRGTLAYLTSLGMVAAQSHRVRSDHALIASAAAVTATARGVYAAAGLFSARGVLWVEAAQPGIELGRAELFGVGALAAASLVVRHGSALATGSAGIATLGRRLRLSGKHLATTALIFSAPDRRRTAHPAFLLVADLQAAGYARFAGRSHLAGYGELDAVGVISSSTVTHGERRVYPVAASRTLANEGRRIYAVPHRETFEADD